MLIDRFTRPLCNLRISVTDRCNLRCTYCMPEEEYVWRPNGEILSFEEISALVDRFIAVGVRKVRLTGGEPLMRRDLSTLVAMLARKPLDDLALTTNGLLLETQARDLREAGLRRVTVSLDTLDPARFTALTRRDALPRVLAGIEAARAAQFPGGMKLDSVVLKGSNDHEVEALLDFGARVGAEVRFIEYMDVGGATRWSREQVYTRAALIARLKATPVVEARTAPAERFRLPDGRAFGIIASTTAPFCGTCDRARLTADGMLFTCLYARTGTELKAPLRANVPAAQLERLIGAVWAERGDRGAEARLALHEQRAPLLPRHELHSDPHLEMHTRGG